MNRLPLVLLTLLAASTAVVSSPPGPPSEANKDKTEPGAEAETDKQGRREAEQVVRSIKVEILRLLTRPLWTYRDQAGGVLDGALFTLANGTNPEIWLFVEARADPKGDSKAGWQYTVGRSAWAELHLECDGKEVFAAPRADQVSAPDKPFWLDVIKAPPDADPRKP